LTDADFRRADLQKVKLGWTTFGDTELSQAKGLETIDHRGPSYIDILTIYRSGGNIPGVFLRGAGVDDNFITYIRSLVGKAIEYYSCFISYSSKDEAIAKRLYADLQSNKVRCWFAPEDLKIGDKIRPRIDESIHLHDKLLLVLSQHSVASQWVEQEVETALSRERKENRTVLFPIRLDGSVMESEGGWPALIRNTRNIGDFTRWKNHNAYQKAFDRLLHDLKAEA
jgi:TIR domain